MLLGIEVVLLAAIVVQVQQVRAAKAKQEPVRVRCDKRQ